jgi:DNA topoisomerase-1
MERAQELINEKMKADAPIAEFDGKPVTKGKGRFGPFIKWNDLFINVPKRYNFEGLSMDDIKELIETKVDKEANRYIRQWPEEKISIENGRWGAYIKFNKKMLKLGKKKDNSKYTPEELQEISIEDVKKMVEAQIPDAFVKKVAAKKAPSKKAVTKKASPKKAAPTKASAKKK